MLLIIIIIVSIISSSSSTIVVISIAIGAIAIIAIIIIRMFITVMIIEAEAAGGMSRNNIMFAPLRDRTISSYGVLQTTKGNCPGRIFGGKLIHSIHIAISLVFVWSQVLLLLWLLLLCVV